ncbi:MAG: SRPBCC domain-containing protein [Acidobacteriota bacterium]
MAWSFLWLVLLATCLVLVLGALLTRKTFHVEVMIAAPPQAVWDVLMETAAYPEWNPTFVKVEGEYAEGAKLQNFVRDPDGKLLEMTAKVTTLDPPRVLRQVGGIPGVLSFDHRWVLEPTAAGTRVTQHEVDRGIGLWFWNSSWIEPAYDATNAALKRRVLATTQ